MRNSIARFLRSLADAIERRQTQAIGVKRFNMSSPKWVLPGQTLTITVPAAGGGGGPIQWVEFGPDRGGGGGQAHGSINR